MKRSAPPVRAARVLRPALTCAVLALAGRAAGAQDAGDPAPQQAGEPAAWRWVLPLEFSFDPPAPPAEPEAPWPRPQDVSPDAASGAPAESAADRRKQESPWMLVPVFSVDPKLGTSLGALAGYLHYFDEESKVSIFGVTAQYTSTGSVVAAAFGKASFDEDRQRIATLLMGGNIKNDYHDFLGTGLRVKTEDEIRGFVARYLHRVVDDWFLGVQGVVTNFKTYGQDPFDTEVLNTLGLMGFDSGGIGLAVYHDSRDNENMPAHGWMLNANNVAYRDWIAGSDSFDVYRADLRVFVEEGGGHVLAIRQMNQWTVDAPGSGEAPVMLRGYKIGQYKGENMSSIEAEERLRLGKHWTATAFAGVAGIYGGGRSLSDSENLFPAAGLGIQYVLKPEAGIVLNLEYAVGKDGNYGVYLKLGYGF